MQPLPVRQGLAVVGRAIHRWSTTASEHFHAALQGPKRSYAAAARDLSKRGCWAKEPGNCRACVRKRSGHPRLKLRIGTPKGAQVPGGAQHRAITRPPKKKQNGRSGRRGSVASRPGNGWRPDTGGDRDLNALPLRSAAAESAPGSLGLLTNDTQDPARPSQACMKRLRDHQSQQVKRSISTVSRFPIERRPGSPGPPQPASAAATGPITKMANT